MVKLYLKILIVVLLSMSFFTAMSRSVSVFETRISILDTLKAPTFNIFSINQNSAASKIFNYHPKPFKVQDLYPNYSRATVSENESAVSKLKFENSKKNIKSNSESSTKKNLKSNDEEILNVELIQNVKIFPNPVQSQLNIGFELSSKASIMIKITDILGNEVMTLLNANLDEGKFTKSFQIAGKINSGTYFVRIMAANSVKVARIIIQ